MEQKKINIAELLKDCPSGMELDCVSYDNVEFDYVEQSPESTYPIHCLMKTNGRYSALVFTHNGCNDRHPNAKCVIFPKGKTTWEGFIPPSKVKDGDVVTYKYENGLVSMILNKFVNFVEVHYHCALYDNAKGFVTNNYIVGEPKYTHLATEEEKAKLFQAIKDNGYKWNAETKTLEKLVEPKFKVGNIVQDEDGYKVKITEVNLEDECYGYESMIAKGIGAIPFKEQNNWELVPNKFDITTLKPFDKVLVRDCNTDKWNIDLFAYYRDRNDYQCMTFTKNQCIPYESNQHLLGTTNNCDEYYKTWE